MMQTSQGNLYRVSFLSQGRIYELYARQLSRSGLDGFIEIEQLVFGARSGPVVDPGEERIKREFADVVRTFIPMHAVLHIDEVSRQGAARIFDAGTSSKITPFPAYTPGDRNKG